MPGGICTKQADYKIDMEISLPSILRVEYCCYRTFMGFDPHSDG